MHVQGPSETWGPGDLEAAGEIPPRWVVAEAHHLDVRFGLGQEETGFEHVPLLGWLKVGGQSLQQVLLHDVLWAHRCHDLLSSGLGQCVLETVRRHPLVCLRSTQTMECEGWRVQTVTAVVLSVFEPPHGGNDALCEHPGARVTQHEPLQLLGTLCAQHCTGDPPFVLLL